jgi:hypothetical protein
LEILALTLGFHFPDNPRKKYIILSLLDVTACETETPIRVEYAGDCRFVCKLLVNLPRNKGSLSTYHNKAYNMLGTTPVPHITINATAPPMSSEKLNMLDNSTKKF